MPRARRTFLAAQVWLTAFLTLLSGAPRWACVCPDGRIKPFCLSLLAGYCPGDARPEADGKAHGCCCGGRDASPSDTAVEAPCCKAKRAASGERSGSGIGRPGCHKTLTPSAVATPPAPDGGRPSGGLEAALLRPCVVPTFAGTGLIARTPPRPPGHGPGDLVVSLQRLVI